MTQWQLSLPSTSSLASHTSGFLSSSWSVSRLCASIGKTKTNLGMYPAVICIKSVWKSLSVDTYCVDFAVLLRGRALTSLRDKLNWTSGGRIIINKMSRSTPCVWLVLHGKRWTKHDLILEGCFGVSSEGDSWRNTFCNIILKMNPSSIFVFCGA